MSAFTPKASNPAGLTTMFLAPNKFFRQDGRALDLAGHPQQGR